MTDTKRPKGSGRKYSAGRGRMDRSSAMRAPSRISASLAWNSSSRGQVSRMLRSARPSWLLGRDAGARQDALDLGAQQRDGARIAVVGAGREQAQEQPRPGGLPAGAEDAGRDHVGVLRPVDGGAHVGLRDRGRLLLGEGGPHAGVEMRQAGQRIEDRHGRIAQQAQVLGRDRRGPVAVRA
jgi:hypothetical protein